VSPTRPHPEPALLALPNVVMTPHIGSAVVELREQMAHVVADNILAVMDGRRAPNCANPEVYEGR
jgi:glyoxylate reductase